MDRPLGVTTVAILVAVNGIVALARGFVSPLAEQDTLASMLMFMLGLVMLYLAFALWTLRPWAWIQTLYIEGISVVVDLGILTVSPSATGPWVSLALASTILLLLFRPEVRDSIERRAQM